MVVSSGAFVWAIAKMAGKITYRQINRGRAIVGEDLRWLALIMVNSLAHCFKTGRLSLEIPAAAGRHFHRQLTSGLTLRRYLSRTLDQHAVCFAAVSSVSPVDAVAD